MPRSKQSRARDGASAPGDSGEPVARQPSNVAAEVDVVRPNGRETCGPAGVLAASDDELWSLKAVVAKTGLSRSSIYSYVELGLFPRQRRLGPRRVGWLASEVRAWIASRPL
jgi:prophage regulatory protein